MLKVHSKGDVNLCAASDLVCLKHTDAFSQRVDKVRSLRNVQSFVDRRLFDTRAFMEEHLDST